MHASEASTLLPCADTRNVTVFNGRRSYSARLLFFPSADISHFLFASTSLPCTQHSCLAQLRHKNHIGLQQAEIFLHSAQLLFFHLCRHSHFILPQHCCLALTQEPHWSSTNINVPALSTAAVLSLCPHFTNSFLLFFAFVDIHISILPQQCCLA